MNTLTKEHEAIRGLKKTIKKIEKANKDLKEANTRVSWRWRLWQWRHVKPDKQIEKYHQISTHQLPNNIAEYQQGFQAGLAEWKEDSKSIRKKAITELAEIAKLQKLQKASAN